jgi:hypothetical protein
VREFTLRLFAGQSKVYFTALVLRSADSPGAANTHKMGISAHRPTTKKPRRSRNLPGAVGQHHRQAMGSHDDIDQ